MKRVLVVTPNWPPISCPDLHRVRMALPFFAEFGWDPLILKIDPDEQEGIRDPLLCDTVPENIRTWQAGAIPRRWTAWFGLNSVGLRSIFHLARLGSKIIEKEQPAVIFFSTTMFPVMILGRYWRWLHGVSYILDFQDPWRDERRVTDLTTRRSLKQRLTTIISAILEPFALRGACHVVSVSPQYPVTLTQRYSWIQPEQFTVLPFGAAEGDFALLPRLGVQQTIFDPNDGRQHWVYVGRGGGDMAFAARALFVALRNAKHSSPQMNSNIMIHFIGTDYAPADRSKKSIEPIAVECEVAEYVHEISTRIPYFEALRCLLDADALIVLGSNDNGYTASKIYPYILANKPMLAIFHEDSSVVEVSRSTGAGTVVTFNDLGDTAALATEIGARWFSLGDKRPSCTNWNTFDQYTARQMTRRLCDTFDAVATNS